MLGIQYNIILSTSSVVCSMLVCTTVCYHGDKVSRYQFATTAGIICDM